MTRARTFALDIAVLALLALIALGTGHLVLTTALTIPDTVAQAERLRGM